MTHNLGRGPYKEVYVSVSEKTNENGIITNSYRCFNVPEEALGDTEKELNEINAFLQTTSNKEECNQELNNGVNENSQYEEQKDNPTDNINWEENNGNK